MGFNEQFNFEAAESVYRQINYYCNLPKHVKLVISTETISTPNTLTNDGTNSPACVINDKTTVVDGKLNIPTVSKPYEFKNQNVSCEHP